MESKKLGLRNYLGYAVCDTGNSLGFSVASTYLASYYTDVVGLSGFASTAIMIVARIWDAVNDPIMGFAAHRGKPTRFGKYRHFLLFAGIPYAIASVLLFSTGNSGSYNLRVALCALTYIICGMLYTVVLVPYGSLASVMTHDTLERSRLSVCRSIGGGIGSAPAGMLLPLLIFSDDKIVGGKLLKTMLVICVLMCISYVLAFFSVHENVPPEKNPPAIKVGPTVRSLIKNRPFVLMSIIGCLLIASSMYLHSSGVYLFKDYFRRTGFVMTLYTVISYAPMVIMIPFTDVIIKKIGKKEFSIIGLAVSTLAAVILCIHRVTNPWVFIVFSAFINMGVGFLTLEIWAFAADVIDVQELNTKKREESVTYAVFTFMRKIGQAVAACVPLLLQFIGYDNAAVGNQTQQVCVGIYRVATTGPAVMFALMLLCFALYPLSRTRMKEIGAELAVMRNEKALPEEDNT